MLLFLFQCTILMEIEWDGSTLQFGERSFRRGGCNLVAAIFWFIFKAHEYVVHFEANANRSEKNLSQANVSFSNVCSAKVLLLSPKSFPYTFFFSFSFSLWTLFLAIFFLFWFCCCWLIFYFNSYSVDWCSLFSD